MPGNEALERQLGHRDAGTASYVINYDVCNRYARAALGGEDLRRSGPPRAGVGRFDRRSYIPGLRAGLGRLHPRRICRPAAAHVRFRVQGHRRAVVCQSLYVRRRVRYGRRAAPQGHSAGAVRDAPPARRGRWRHRARGDLAPRPTRQRPVGRTGRAFAARAVSDLLRPHVHEPEGCAVCRCDGDPDHGSGTPRRGISGALAAHDPDRRLRRRPVARLPCAWRVGAGSNNSAGRGRARRRIALPMWSTC
jgi:hypothetical protein